MTRFDQIAGAFPLHAQRIAECVNAWDPQGFEAWCDSEPSYSGAHRALYQAFPWDETTEGGDYWLALADGAPRS